MENIKNITVELEKFIEEGIRPIDPTDNKEATGYINGNIEIKKILEENSLNRFISIVTAKENKLDPKASERVKGKKEAYREAIEKYNELYY